MEVFLFQVPIGIARVSLIAADVIERPFFTTNKFMELTSIEMQGAESILCVGSLTWTFANLYRDREVRRTRRWS